MKKLLALSMVFMLFSPVIAHPGHDSMDSRNESSSADYQDKKQSDFGQIYPEYRSGTIWVVIEVLVVLGALILAGRHYFQKSGSSSLKEFIRERVL